MNKSKFKNVKVKHFGGVELVCKKMFDSQNVWQGTLNNWDYFRFSEDTIKLYPELFEVEKAEREFEEGAWYKARYREQSLPEVIKYIFGKFFRTSDVMGSHRHYAGTDFYEIGEKIEL